MTYSYDDNGNVTGGNTLAANYDAGNLAWYVSRAGAGLDHFAYSAEGERYWHQDSAGTQTWYGEGGYEKIRRNGVLEHRHHLPGAIVTVGAMYSRVTYVHKDRLGSTIMLTDESGQVVGDGTAAGLRRGYDPFGGARTGELVDRPAGTLGLEPRQNRGFTGHEHLDSAQLIHMNGRMYDPRLGRFLGVDPVVQFPANSQSLNPYSYILNNPLSGTDPTGYQSCSATDLKLGASCETGRRVTEVGSRISRAETATVTGLGKDSAGNITATVSLSSGGSMSGVVGRGLSANGSATGQSVNGPGRADRGSVGSRGAAPSDISSGTGDVAGARPGRAGSQEVRPPTRGERQNFLQHIEDERRVIVDRMNLLAAVSAMTGDWVSAHDFSQSASRFGVASIVDELTKYGPNHAEYRFVNTDFVGGEPTVWRLEVYRGAWDAFKRGSPASSGYTINIPAGLTGLRQILTHESGHAVSRFNFSINSQGRIKSLDSSVMERYADEWVRKVWPE